MRWPPMTIHSLRNAVRDFLRRDYIGDVAKLNGALARAGHSSAGLESAPPSVLTGNPFALSPGSCVAIFGLNPKWHDKARAEADLLRSEIAREAFAAHEARRAAYFLDRSQEYYGRYFTRLGNLIRNSPLEINAPDARSLFREHAFKLDLLPWWSVDTSHIEPSNLTSNIAPLYAWREIVGQFIMTLRPQIILVNGIGFRPFAEAILDVDLSQFVYGSNRNAFFGVSGYDGTPVLVHGQVNSINGPGTDLLYRDLIQSWRALRR